MAEGKNEAAQRTTSAEKSAAAVKEEEVLQFWQENDIFRKTLEKDAPGGTFMFYDGPPFANGLPHYGHIIASVIKDAVPRYWTMKGYHVPRRWGWDCHGLPVENEVEKELGFKSKKEIEEYGVARFNEACRDSVLRYADEWKKIIPRIGRFADMDDPYTSMDRDFMESVWWVFKQLWDKGLVYEDYRSMHICPRCETTLSQQEIAEGYTEITDLSVTAQFELSDEPGTFLLAWTTTPWTLPGNVALAVGTDISYVKVISEGNTYIVAEERVEDVFADKEYEIQENVSAGDLIGRSYAPLFDYYAKDTSLEHHENGWKVYEADFVTTDEGTGIVHVAPAFGEEDMELGKEKQLPFVQHIANDGTFKDEVTDFAGMSVKPKDDVQATDVEIVKLLAHTGKLFSKEKITHSYPLCWRCDTPLLNYATSSWFVAVTKVKDDLLEYAENINWSPAHIKEGRFGHWLAGARDWSVSRQRFWASVIPIWKCEQCEDVHVFGSVAELEEASGTEVNDLHKHVVDEILVPCECGGQARRIPDVLDTWFDSGSMPYAQMHYPFDNEVFFERTFPANFIAEGIDQTRAWFYYLHVLGGALFGSRAFDNVIVNGVVLAEDGKKMSKKLKNYPDPQEVVDHYGADALRLYLLSSPIVRAENLNFSERGVDEVSKKTIGRLANVVLFYTMYAPASEHASSSTDHVLDRWIRTRCEQVVREVTEAMDNYELDRATRPLGEFVDDLSTWYLRRSRERIKASGEDAAAALATLREVLTTFAKVSAPFIPFTAEWLWQQVEATEEAESVHLAAWPQARDAASDELLGNMQAVRDVISKALEQRAVAGIKVRQPLAKLTVRTREPFAGEYEAQLIELVRDEVNVKEVAFDDSLGDELALDTNITPELAREGEVRGIIRTIQDLRKKHGLEPGEHATVLIGDAENTNALLAADVKETIEQATATTLIAGDGGDGTEVTFDGASYTVALQT